MAHSSTIFTDERGGEVRRGAACCPDGWTGTAKPTISLYSLNSMPGTYFWLPGWQLPAPPPSPSAILGAASFLGGPARGSCELCASTLQRRVVEASRGTERGRPIARGRRKGPSLPVIQVYLDRTTAIRWLGEA
jgi:hypothetical protein